MDGFFVRERDSTVVGSVGGRVRVSSESRIVVWVGWVRSIDVESVYKIYYPRTEESGLDILMGRRPCIRFELPLPRHHARISFPLFGWLLKFTKSRVPL